MATDHLNEKMPRVGRKAILTELAEELKNPGSYQPRPAYAYFPPKNELCYRRMIYIHSRPRCPISFVITVLDLLDLPSPSCFANRRARGKARQTKFLEDFASAWPSFCK